MIEKNIFQTYKTSYNELDEYAKHTSSTWINKNSSWEYKYFSDSDIEDFVRDCFGKDWLNLLLSVPVGVMKSDIWRCMALYEYGGMYADLDTICTEPVDSWVNNSADAIFSWCQDGYIQNWAFLSRKQEPVLEKILYNIEESIKNNNTLDIDYVYNTTGPAVFTKSIIEYVEYNSHNIDIINDVDYFTTGKVVHLNAARFWKFNSYDSWNDELERKINEIV